VFIANAVISCVYVPGIEAYFDSRDILRQKADSSFYQKSDQ